MPGVIANTLASFPSASRFDSVPSKPSKLSDFGYRNPSIWSKERFSSITSTTWSIESRPAICAPLGSPGTSEPGTVVHPMLGMPSSAAPHPAMRDITLAIAAARKLECCRCRWGSGSSWFSRAPTGLNKRNARSRWTSAPSKSGPVPEAAALPSGRRPGAALADLRSWRYYLSFADHGDTAGGYGQAAGPVVLLVHPDRGAFQDGHVLVQDGVLDHGAAADPGIVQDHRPVHTGPAVYPGSRRQD